MRVDLAGGGDFDLGWNGAAHNQGTVAGPTLFVCLHGCDIGADATCSGRGPVGEESINGESLGPPQPVLIAGAPFCLASQLTEEIVLRTLDLQTGAIDMRIAMSFRFFSTSDEAHPCPTCSGGTVGAPGVCAGGPSDGAACTTEGVDTTFGNTSSDCPPSPVGNAGTVTIAFDPLTSGTAELEGQIACDGGLCACPGQIRVNQCVAESPCVPDNCPSDGVGAGTLPGMDQACCRVSATETEADVSACFPSGISRTGQGASPQPQWPDPGYPKVAVDVTLASSFCVPSPDPLGASQLIGLPGPGAMVLPAVLHVGSESGPPPTSTTTTTTSTTTTTMFMTGVTGPTRS
jgi:hypothetical protein